MAHTDEQIMEGLAALAAAGGNSAQAVVLLRATGHDAPSDRTLRNWRDQHADRYMEFAAKHEKNVEARAVQVYRECLGKAAELTAELLDMTREDMESDRRAAREEQAIRLEAAREPGRYARIVAAIQSREVGELDEADRLLADRIVDSSRYVRKTKDPSAAARNVATAGAILNDKLLVMTDRPNHIAGGPRDVDALIRRAGELRLLTMGIGSVDGTCEEEPPPALEAGSNGSVS